jgi:tetratricopeptide (TPR) repeat protein
MSVHATVNNALRDAIAAYKARRYAKAEVLVDRLLAQTPQEAAALQLKALLSHLRRDPRAAHVALVASLALRPGHAPTLAIASETAKSLAAIAEKARANGWMEDAIRDFRRALELSGASAPIWFALGLTLQDHGDYAAAADAFARVIGLRPQDAKAMVNHGVSLQQVGDLDSAWASYRSACRTDPSTFAAISQALPAANVGVLVLDLRALRERLSR